MIFCFNFPTNIYCVEHLSLEIFDLDGGGTKYAALDENASITIVETSEVFGSGDVWSYPFSLNIPSNSHIFGTSGDLHGSRIHDVIDGRRARLWIDGLPLYLGYLRLDDEVDVDPDGDVSVTFEGGRKTFEKLIEGAKANQVPLLSDVPIGVALWRKRKVKFRVKLSVSATYITGRTSPGSPVTTSSGDDELTFEADGEKYGDAVQQYPRMVFPKGDFEDIDSNALVHVDCLNTDHPYSESADGTPTHPFCNIALCYQQSDYKQTDKDGNVTIDYSAEPEDQRGYEYMPANRVNSAPNFFVIYWLRALMKHLGIYVEENQMLGVEDLRRLFFVNTNCSYREPDKIRGSDHDAGYGRYRFSEGKFYLPEHYAPDKTVNKEESGFSISGVTMSDHPNVDHFTVKVSDVLPWNAEEQRYYISSNNYLHDAFASSDCFPDVNISDVVKALESGFGVRFLFSDNYQRVRIVLLRNLFRSRDIQHVVCDIVDDDVKTENPVRGFRMTYGNTDDTHFFYKGFADLLPHKPELWLDTSDKHDYSHWDLDASYANIISRVSAFDKTCYVTPNTGNAFGIKIDEHAKRYQELRPAVFEFAGFMDAEDGDCTGEEDTICTVSVGFVPAIMNDLNMDEERSGRHDQRFALFVDERMRPRRLDLSDLASPQSYNDSDAVYDVNGKLYAKDDDGKYVYQSKMAGDSVVKPGEFFITSDMFAEKDGLTAIVSGMAYWGAPQWDPLPHFSISGHICEGYRLYLQDNFPPTDDGISPIETHGWGLMLGVMRGSGSDAYVSYSEDPDDGEDNDAWSVVPGSSVTSHPDTCDSYGREWDYNGGGGYDSVYVGSASQAADELSRLFPNSNAPFSTSAGYISRARLFPLSDHLGVVHHVLFVEGRSQSDADFLSQDYTSWLRGWPNGHSLTEMRNMDADTSHGGERLIVETDSSEDRLSTLLDLCEKAYGGGITPGMFIDNGIGSRYGRFSLKLRAEKPNPYYEPGSDDPMRRDRYLPISDANLRQRGLSDQFYKEYSYWMRNARILKRTVRLELSQLLSLDMTTQATVGDVTGFIRTKKIPYNNKSGLGNVSLEIMYI